MTAHEETALIIVDMQNDFVNPNGTLYVKGAEQLIPVINKTIAELPGVLIITTQDWHPADHSQFLPTGRWPSHCVAGTPGADIVAGLEFDQNAIRIFKGSEPDQDGYSGFEGSLDATEGSLSLNQVLVNHGIKNVYICGVATDYCVRATALDAKKHGYNTFILTHAIMGVHQDTTDAALLEMDKAGVNSMMFR